MGELRSRAWSGLELLLSSPIANHAAIGENTRFSQHAGIRAQQPAPTILDIRYNAFNMPMTHMRQNEAEFRHWTKTAELGSSHACPGRVDALALACAC